MSRMCAGFCLECGARTSPGDQGMLWLSLHPTDCGFGIPRLINNVGDQFWKEDNVVHLLTPRLGVKTEPCGFLCKDSSKLWASKSSSSMPRASTSDVSKDGWQSSLHVRFGSLFPTHNRGLFHILWGDQRHILTVARTQKGPHTHKHTQAYTPSKGIFLP